jgi:glycosyltransferase involved in cell wall biosynthesis
MPLVSIVIPVFNGKRFIGETIQSALDQTFRDFEVIVVDDGSTDGTEEIVGLFTNSVSYHRQENRGAGAARNLGVTFAQGEWIAFLDADDIWYPQKLTVQVDFTKTHPNAAFVYSDMDTIDSHGVLSGTKVLSAKLSRAPRGHRRNLPSLAFHGQLFPYPSTVLVKRELFLEIGGFSPLFRRNYHEDFDLFARIAHVTPLHFISQSLVKYRILPRTKSAEDSSEENWLILLRRLSELWHYDTDRQKLLDWLVVKHWSDRGKRLLRAGDSGKARECFWQAFRRRPFYWRNLRRLGLSYLPGARKFYIVGRSKAAGTSSGRQKKP